MSQLSDVPALSLLVLRAVDPERLCQFYGALGLRFVREQHGSGPVHHASEMGESVFEIYPRKPEEPPTSGARLGFNVRSLDRVLEALNLAKATLISAPTSTRYGRRAVVQDPEGHKIELLERVSA